jgi:hypothetical protein
MLAALEDPVAVLPGATWGGAGTGFEEIKTEDGKEEAEAEEEDEGKDEIDDEDADDTDEDDEEDEETAKKAFDREPFLPPKASPALTLREEPVPC